MLNLFQYRSWALAEAYFSRMAPLLRNAAIHGHDLVKKQTMGDFVPRIEALLQALNPDTDRVAITSDPWTGETIIPTVKVGGQTIAIIPIIGPITKNGDACSYGGHDYQRFIAKVNLDEKVGAIVLLMDTPGGTVDGTPELAISIKSSTKPIVVFGDSMVASAGMWLASQASYIIGNKNNPTSFGSIGTLMISENWKNVMDAGNFPNVEIIRAPQSTEKALINWIEPLSEELRAELSDELKNVTNEFIRVVKEGRGDKLNTKLDGLFKGRMFDAGIAKQNGLIDGLGTIHTAINKAAELARQKSKEGSNVSTNTGAQSNMKFKFLSNLFSGEAWNKVAGIFSSEEDQKTLEATEKKVADLDAEITRLKDEAKATGEKITALEATVSGQTAQITTLEGEKKTLQSKLDEKPKGELTTVIADANKEAKNANEQEGEKKGQYATSVDADAKKIREDKAKLSTYK